MQSPFSLAAGALAVMLLSTDCRFDESGIPPGTFPQFDGCFQGGVGEEIVLTLDNHRRVLLEGMLVRTRNQDERIMAVAGEVESETLAVLEGIFVGEGSSREIIVLSLPVDRLSLQVDDGPPLGPLSRCP